LLHFRRIAPSDRLEEFGKPALVSCKVETKLPDEVFLLGVERLGGCIIEYFLRTACEDAIGA
jgi:hypothetical protein